ASGSRKLRGGGVEGALRHLPQRQRPEFTIEYLDAPWPFKACIDERLDEFSDRHLAFAAQLARLRGLQFPGGLRGLKITIGKFNAHDDIRGNCRDPFDGNLKLEHVAVVDEDAAVRRA